ncbi:MAG: hypothetical protein ABIG44_05870 [Planctomycetota bacterium]
MMINTRRGQALGVCLPVVLALLSLPGCARPKCEIELLSYKDPYFPEPYRVTFDTCVFRRDAGGDFHIAGLVTSSVEDQESATITQYLCVHVFWKPYPGRTFANSTTNDATIRYVIVTADGMAAYAGTGFILPKLRRDKLLTATIENANLKLVAQTGNPAEILGDARLTGTLQARRDDHQTIDLTRQLELYAAGEQ